MKCTWYKNTLVKNLAALVSERPDIIVLLRHDPMSLKKVQVLWNNRFFIGSPFTSSGSRENPGFREKSIGFLASLSSPGLELLWRGQRGQGEGGLWRMPWRSSGKARITASMWARSLERVPGWTGSCSLSAWVWDKRKNSWGSLWKGFDGSEPVLDPV